MVPFGPKAFFPGQLKHTNEILVLLGDNWFAERSAKQAVEIVDRRLKR
jgi:unconventional prefoldin RPB5 interactor 1